jgi:hypothetical protein
LLPSPLFVAASVSLVFSLLMFKWHRQWVKYNNKASLLGPMGSFRVSSAIKRHRRGSIYARLGFRCAVFFIVSYFLSHFATEILTTIIL